jgi:hypothetical protein
MQKEAFSHTIINFVFGITGDLFPFLMGNDDIQGSTRLFLR